LCPLLDCHWSFSSGVVVFAAPFFVPTGAAMIHRPDPQPADQPGEHPPAEEPDDGTTEAEDDEVEHEGDEGEAA
jgi:hypothetical protein